MERGRGSHEEIQLACVYMEEECFCHLNRGHGGMFILTPNQLKGLCGLKNSDNLWGKLTCVPGV